MIARLWRGVTSADREEEYLAYLQRTGAADCRATAGNLGVQVLHRPLPNGRTEFLFISYWDSLDSIRAFAGPDVERAHYYPEDTQFLEELTPSVEHWTDESENKEQRA
jgi:heme-degrading monooxygenase HmoA